MCQDFPKKNENRRTAEITYLKVYEESSLF